MTSERNHSSFNFYKLDKTRNSVVGYHYLGSKFEETWSINFAEDEKILDYSYHLKDHPEFFTKAHAGYFIHIPEENKVIYKIVDSSNIAVLTKSAMTQSESPDIVNLNLYVINTRTGRILQQFTQNGVNSAHAIALTYDDNGIFISYFKDSSKYYELWVVELFEEQIESSFVTMINKFMLKTMTNKEVDYYNENGNFVLLDQKFGLPYGIKQFKPVQTKSGLTRRNLIAITTDNQVVSLDRYLTSTRRPLPVVETPKKKSKKKQIPEEEEVTYQSSFLPVYEYMIPYNPKAQLNGDYDLKDLRDLDISETTFESTAVVFAYGKDLFWCKVTPDKMFDMLNDDFNYLLLIAIAVGITVATFVAMKVGSSKEAKNRWIS